MANSPSPDDFSTAHSVATGRGPFAKNWNLVTKSLAEQEQHLGIDKVWGHWIAVKGFPKDLDDAGQPRDPRPTAEDRYRFIDAYLTRELGEVRHPEQPKVRLRPDLNGKEGTTRAWLMHKILVRLDQKTKPDYRPVEDEYVIPEDLPIAINDINILLNHRQKLPADKRKTLQHYKSLEQLAHDMQDYRTKQPISDDERTAAHHKFLNLRNDDGSVLYDGNGEAERLAILPGGFEVIHLKSAAAALAYGSPDWCTAFRQRETLFNNYSDDLLIAISPLGERWQFHFRKIHLMDSQNVPIKNLPKFFERQPGLAATLMPAMLRALPEIPLLPSVDKPAHTMKRFLTLAKDVPEWRATLASPEHLVTTLLKHGITNSALVTMLEVIKDVPEWMEVVDRHNVIPTLFGDAIRNFEEMAKSGQFNTSVINLIKTVKNEPKLQAMLCRPDMLPALFQVGVATKRMDFVVDLFREVIKTPELKKAMPPEILIPLLQHAAENEINHSAQSFRVSSSHGRVGVMEILREAKPDDRSGDSFAQFFAQISGEVTEKAFVDIPAWRETLAKPEGLPAALAIVAANRNLKTQVTSMMATAKTVPEWHAALAEPAGLPAALMAAMGPGHDLKAFYQILNDGLKYPVWKAGLAKPDGLPAVITAAAATKNYEAILHILESLRIEQPGNSEWGNIIPGSTIMAAVKSAVENHASEKAQRILERTHYIQPWRDAMIASHDIPDLVAKAASQPVSRDNLEVGFGALMASAFLPEWQQQTSGDNVLKLFQQAVALKADIAVEKILSHTKHIPHWRDRLAQADGIAAAIDHDMSSGSDGYWVQEKIRYGVKDVPEWNRHAGHRPTNAAMQQYPAAKIADTKKAAG